MADNNEITSETVVTTRRLAGVVAGVWGKVHDITDIKAPLASPALTGTPTAPTAAEGTNTTQIATTAFVKTAVEQGMAQADALKFKGTIGAAADNPTVESLPTPHEAGWTYKVVTDGTYAGEHAEVGDLIICTADSTTASDDDWTVVQSNIDGAVTGPASSVSGHVAIFDGATGKVISDSGAAIDDVYDSTSGNVATHKAVAAAINALDVNNITGLGADKTITALSETDGKIEATASDIAITGAQVTVANATNGHLASLDANGHIADSTIPSASDSNHRVLAHTSDGYAWNAWESSDHDIPNETVTIAGKTYDVVTAAGRLWITEDLAAITEHSILNDSGDPNARLYQIRYMSEVEALLPAGWRIANGGDWDALKNSGITIPDMKSTTGWSTRQGTNGSGLNFYPFGYLNGSTWSYKGQYSCHYRSTNSNRLVRIGDANAYAYDFSYSNPNDSTYLAVRLVKDII